MKNISSVRDCYGCGVCATVCPRRIISIELSSDGFYQPSILQADGCIDCGLCVRNCSFLHDDLALETPQIRSFAVWSRDHAVRRKCSSGGVGFEVGRQLIARGYKVCGVRYNAGTARAEHYVASSEIELIPSIGSKYIQSYTLDGFRQIDRKHQWLVTGTPCQIDSFRRWVGKSYEDNFVFLDFFCHGVPSMLLWRKYILEAEKITGKVTYASWRNKHTGWHDSWAMGLDGEEHGERVNWHDSYNVQIRGKKSFLQSRLSQGDSFYVLFLGDVCLGKACYEHCKFKWDHSSADIRIGDLWGRTYESDEDGVSAVVTFTKRGEEVLRSCNLEIREHPIGIVAEGQMKTAPERPSVRRKIMDQLREESQPLSVSIATYRAWQRRRLWYGRISHPLRSAKRIMKKIATRP